MIIFRDLVNKNPAIYQHMIYFAKAFDEYERSYAASF